MDNPVNKCMIWGYHYFRSAINVLLNTFLAFWFHIVVTCCLFPFRQLMYNGDPKFLIRCFNGSKGHQFRNRRFPGIIILGFDSWNLGPVYFWRRDVMIIHFVKQLFFGINFDSRFFSGKRVTVKTRWIHHLLRKEMSQLREAYAPFRWSLVLWDSFPGGLREMECWLMRVAAATGDPIYTIDRWMFPKIEVPQNWCFIMEKPY